jgi:D-glycero-D-manno-heptose 1,7-bisphosphate phosphatase
MKQAISSAVFLDRDGVLIEDVDFLLDPAQIRILEGVPEALVQLKTLGFKMIVVSNQAVVARGLADEAGVVELQREVEKRLAGMGGPSLDGFYFCPHHPNATLPDYRQICNCRKPQPGMLFRAAEERGISLPDSFMIGDRPTDILAGQRAGCRNVWVQTGKHTAPMIETAGPIAHPQADHICSSLLEAAQWIRRFMPEKC